MDTFGKTIQYIRKSRNISQAELAYQIMSRSNLSKFECSSYNLSYQKFFLLLQRLNITFEEFIYIHNDFKLSESDSLQQQLVNVDNKNEIDKISSIAAFAKQMMHAGEKSYKTVYYMAEHVLSQHHRDTTLTNKEIKLFVQEKLINSDNWFLYEFRLLNNFIEIFNLDELCFLVNRAIKEFEKYQEILIRNNVHIHLLMNAACYCYKKSEFTISLTYFRLAKTYAYENNLLFQAIICDCYICIIQLNSNTNTSKYHKRLKINFTIFAQFGYDSLVRSIQKDYTQR